MDIKTRAINIITKPAAEWSVIATESQTIEGLMKGYAAPLAAIPALCGFIGQVVVGVPVPLMGMYRTGVVRGLVGAIVSWVLALVGAYVAAVIVEKLAPKFQSSGGTAQALKLVVFASTPVWLAGVLSLVPVLSPLAILAALYAIYLFYLGLPRVMHTPAPQVIPYMAVSALVIIVIYVVLGMCTAALVGVGSALG